jgi:flavin reductase
VSRQAGLCFDGDMIDPQDTMSSSSLGVLYKAAMRRLATTVTLVTCAAPEGRAGMTATAVTSVTTEPPALLACINHAASLHGSLRMHSAFCVNLLSESHADLSMAFGGQVAPENRFDHGHWVEDEDGTPYLVDAQSNIFCLVDAMLAYGTHTIFVGRVTRIHLHGEVRPLIYGDGKFLPI